MLQHKDNPVDWFPWGKEAFERSKKEDKPIFLSIGYSACHWCHVMEEESFEDQETADFLNKNFVSINCGLNFGFIGRLKTLFITRLICQ